MPLHPAEEATIRAFFVSARRARFIEQLANPKGRAKALDVLNRFDYLDSKWIASTALVGQGEIVAALRAAGAPEICHVISEDPRLDGRDLPLGDAVAAAEAFDFASILCGLPGRAAFAFGEAYAPRHRVLLSRPSG